MSKEVPNSENWTRDYFRRVVEEVVATGVLKGARVEARPEWSMPGAVVVGQIREMLDSSRCYWIIGGPDVSTDIVNSDVARTPRDALRHFCLQWQLGADQVINASSKDPETGEHYRAKAWRLQKQAEDLYEIVEADQFWSETNPGQFT